MPINDNIRVLIAEDSQDMRETLKDILEMMGYDVVGEAADGREAIEMTADLLPDVVLMDINMQNLNGLEATRLIAASTPTPVVILSAHESQDLVLEASRAGAGGYLKKPPDPGEIERAIAVAVARFGDMIELRRLTYDLQIRNQELDSFAHTVAHDLKNPLQMVVAYANMMRTESDIEPEDIATYIEEIEIAGKRMQNIIEELLLLAQTSTAEVRLQPIDMKPIVEEAIARLSYLIDEHDAEIILTGDWPPALGYAAWVEEVWVNYISNAIRYGGTPPRLELCGVLRLDGYAFYWVQDSGPGISYEQQSQLFMPFQRLSQVDTKGHGLGLSIVRQIVEKLGGEVGVESEPGEGSVFTFTLPRVPRAYLE